MADYGSSLLSFECDREAPSAVLATSVGSVNDAFGAESPTVKAAAAELKRALARELQVSASAVARPLLAPLTAVPEQLAQWVGAGYAAVSTPVRNLVWGRKPSSELAELCARSKYRVLENRLSRAAVLDDSERELVHRVGCGRRRIHQAGTEMVGEGEAASRPMVIVSGWACRYRLLSRGRRQIVSLVVPGDAVGLHRFADAVSTTHLAALTTVETVDGAALLGASTAPGLFPGLSKAVDRLAEEEQEFLINQVVRLGSSLPHEQLAHLLLELRWRLAESGLATERELPLPLTLQTIGDVLALKPGAVHQAFRKLRRIGAVRFGGGRAEFDSRTPLHQIAEFSAPAAGSLSRSTVHIADAPALGMNAALGAS